MRPAVRGADVIHKPNLDRDYPAPACRLSAKSTDGYGETGQAVTCPFCLTDNPVEARDDEWGLFAAALSEGRIA